MQYHPQTPYEDSDEFFKRHYYIEEPRPKVMLDTIGIRRLGAMQETLIDALHLTLLADDPQQKLHMRDLAFIAPVRKLPDYVLAAIGDYRAAPSFFRKDKPRIDATAPLKPTTSRWLPAPVLFAEEMHRQSRNLGTGIGQLFKQAAWEGESFDRVKELVARYDTKVEEYKEQVTLHGNAYAFAAQKPVYAQFESEFGDIAEALKKELGAVREFTLKQKDKSVTVSNEPCLHGGFAGSRPLQALFAFRTAGKEGIDADIHPVAGFRLLTDLVGVESDLMLVMDTLQQRLTQAGHDAIFFGPKQQAQMKTFLEKNARGLQLLLAFHQTMGTLSELYAPPYADIAAQDMRDFLSLIGKDAKLESLETPKEVAAMLFAVEKAIAKKPHEAGMDDDIRRYADAIGAMSNMEMLSARYARDEAFLARLSGVRAWAQTSAQPAVAETLDLIEAAIDPTRRRAKSAEGPSRRAI